VRYAASTPKMHFWPVRQAGPRDGGSTPVTHVAAKHRTSRMDPTSRKRVVCKAAKPVAHDFVPCTKAILVGSHISIFSSFLARRVVSPRSPCLVLVAPGIALDLWAADVWALCWPKS